MGVASVVSGARSSAVAEDQAPNTTGASVEGLGAPREVEHLS